MCASTLLDNWQFQKFRDSRNFSHGWYEGLEHCGVPGGQLLQLREETVRDLIRNVQQIDFSYTPNRLASSLSRTVARSFPDDSRSNW
jgi:hypothetical protein